VYKLKKKEIQAALKEWERKLNAVNSDPAPIMVENEVDLEGPPENFEYINDYRAGNGKDLPFH
jgi:histone-lysine N-methyltransferase SUV39H